MKKLQRMLALVLASILTLGLFTMGVSAKTTEAQTTLTVTKNVQIKQNSTIPNEDFIFQMVPATAAELLDAEGNAVKTSTGDLEIKSGPELKTNGVLDNMIVISFDSSDDTSTAKTGNTAQVTKTGTFDLTKIAFTDVGVYRYYITEVAGSNKFVEYDTTTKYQVDLYVYKYGEALGVGDIVMSKVGATGKPDTAEFTNKVNTCDLIISKTVEGEEYTTNEAFTFYLRIPAGGDSIELSAGDTIHAEIWSTKTNSMVKENDIIVKADLNQQLEDDANIEEEEDIEEKEEPEAADLDDLINEVPEVKVLSGSVFVTAPTAEQMATSTVAQAFTLHDGEYLKIEAPVGMIYFVCEKDVTGEGYVQTYTYLESGTHADSSTIGNNTTTSTPAVVDGEMVVIKGTVNDGTNKVEFTNTRNVTPDTGLSLDLVPYVLVTLIAVCGVALLVCKKRAAR